MPAGLGIDADARVVAGRDQFGAVGHRAVEERGELQIAVAVRARNRRAPGDVLVDEIRHDRPLKLALEIHDVVRDAQAPGHAAGVVQSRRGCSSCRSPASPSRWS